MGCVSSKHRPFRRKSTLKESSSEKRSSGIDSSKIEDWIQPEDRFDSSGSKGDTKVMLIESEMFSSRKFHDHQIGKILENSEVVDHMDQAVPNQELKRVSSVVVEPNLEIDAKLLKQKLDRLTSRDSKARLIESEKMCASSFSDHHQIEKEAEKPETVAPVRAVPRELKRDPSVVGPKASELKQVSAGWPAWLVSVAGEALVNWAPRRANTFEKLEKVSFFYFVNSVWSRSWFCLIEHVSCYGCRLAKEHIAASTGLVTFFITRLSR